MPCHPPLHHLTSTSPPLPHHIFLPPGDTLSLSWLTLACISSKNIYFCSGHIHQNWSNKTSILCTRSHKLCKPQLWLLYAHTVKQHRRCQSTHYTITSIYSILCLASKNHTSSALVFRFFPDVCSGSVAISVVLLTLKLFEESWFWTSSWVEMNSSIIFRTSVCISQAIL